MTTMTEPADPGDAAGFAVRLTAVLPKGDANGLRRWARLLVQQPRDVRVAVIAFDTARVIDDIDTDTDTAVVRVLRIEPLDSAHARDAQQMMLAAAAARSGDTLPGVDGFAEWVAGDQDSGGDDE